jgi:hypothetical protein
MSSTDVTPLLSLQAVYDALHDACPLMIPGMEFIAPSVDASGRPLVYKAFTKDDSFPIKYRDETTLYYWHCEFEKAVAPQPLPSPPLAKFDLSGTVLRDYDFDFDNPFDADAADADDVNFAEAWRRTVMVKAQPVIEKLSCKSSKSSKSKTARTRAEKRRMIFYHMLQQ